MILVRNIKTPNKFIYSIVNSIEYMNTTYPHNRIFDYYQKIKNDKVENGRYMIKRMELKFAQSSWNKYAYHKRYFNYADSGIAFSINLKKDNNIFYLNNFAKMLQMCKYLANRDTSHLYSIVDRRNSGKETFVMNKQNTKFKNRFIILK